ncbi:unnamed protein product [Polarella glacialis]|uniref:Uncharacterized protein n=2 Tax=Polarella glacialis TaxID=89957 RepID=A0A813GCP5_POLGL|nr:unnamed protein product [Polarella glacialis]
MLPLSRPTSGKSLGATNRRAAVFCGLGLCASGAPQAVSGESMACMSRQCLPADSSKGGGISGSDARLCYTNTGHIEAFTRCASSSAPSCSRCLTTPPCESWCEAEAYPPQALGSTCHLDRECGEDVSSQCYMGICRRVLWAGQKCAHADGHDVCLFGGQLCDDGYCESLGTNQACWDGYQEGMDLDCMTGWYCLRASCVPQLPREHTCLGEHPNECSRGLRCNLASSRRQCMAEFVVELGERSSDPRLCKSNHVDPRSGECAATPPYDSSGGDCGSADACVRGDGSTGQCLCKRWWDGTGAPGFCELLIPDLERPSFLAFRALRNKGCHHNWPQERCAYELDKLDLLELVRKESEATSDPTQSVPECAYDFLPRPYSGRAAQPRRLSSAAVQAAKPVVFGF